MIAFNSSVKHSNKIKLEKYLQDIYKIYKRKYNLQGDLILNNSWGQYYYTVSKNICINFKELAKHKRDLQGRGFIFKNRQEFMLNILLHEIRHAIEDKEGKLLKEENFNEFLYDNDREYHHACKFEKRADKFAQRSIKIWKDK
jgi:hypothetical protein